MSYPTGNTAGLIIYLFLLIGALSLFVFLVQKRVQILLTMQKEIRWDRIGERISNLLKLAIGQQQLIKGEFAAGIMHAFIFWGFLAVALNTTHALIGGVLGRAFAFPFLGPDDLLGKFYLVVRDIFEVLVLIMVLFAIYRRAVLKIKRMTTHWEAYLILSFIGILMVTDFIMGGAEVAAGGQSASPIANLLAPSLNPAQAHLTFNVNWWIHIVVLFAFLNFLPIGKHFHVVTSLPDVFFLNLRPRGQLVKMNLEDENIESFGISKVEQFGWKVGLDALTCTECGRCSDGCPADLTGKPLSPKEVNIAIKDHLYEKAPWLLAKGEKKDWEGRSLVGDVVSKDTIWACTTCGYCEEACPLRIEKVQWLVDMRRYLTMNESDFPPEVTQVFKGSETNSNPWALSASSRADWADKLEVPLASDGDFEYLYFVGCAGSFDDRNIRVSQAVTKILKAAGIKFAILGAEEGCCGDSQRRIGNEYLYQMLVQTNIEVMNGYNVKKIITACPHCFNSLKNEYPDFGGKWEVIHHTQLIAQLLNQGKIRLSGPKSNGITYHDSCYLGRYNGIYNAPRTIVRHLTGKNPMEPDAARTREKGFCCGAGGGRMWMEEKLGKRINQTRVEQLVASGASTFASACPYCLTMIGDGIKETERGETHKAMDLAELVADRF